MGGTHRGRGNVGAKHECGSEGVLAALEGRGRQVQGPMDASIALGSQPDCTGPVS